MASKNIGSYSITRPELRRILIAYKVDEKNVERLFSDMEKAHRHINVVTFISLLEKSDIQKPTISNILRRLGMDDVRINNALNMADEQKLASESGRIYEAIIDFD